MLPFRHCILHQTVRHALSSDPSPPTTNLDSLSHVLPAGYWHKPPPKQRICLQYVYVGRCVSNSCFPGLLEHCPLVVIGFVLHRISMSDDMRECCRKPSDADSGSALRLAYSRTALLGERVTHCLGLPSSRYTVSLRDAVRLSSNQVCDGITLSHL